MSDVISVANYILKSKGKMTSLKLQKLVYYSQVWHFVWESEPLFNERIEAWANGPIVPDLYKLHNHKLMVEAAFENQTPTPLTTAEIESIDEVIASYGTKSSFEMSEMIHKESPWLDARKRASQDEDTSKEITLAAIAEYY